MSFLRFATIAKNCGWLVSFVEGRVIDPDENQDSVSQKIPDETLRVSSGHSKSHLVTDCSNGRYQPLLEI
jgi:hypothetical protein